MNYQHTPVLLQPALEFLEPQPGQNFIDATLGGGGYTQALLERIKPKGKVLAIDMDQAAIDNFGKQAQVVLVQGNFAQLQNIVSNHKFSNISGIVADIGLSSYLLDESGRGLSFQKDEPLDMRFDLSSDGDDARFILNNLSVDQLTQIFRDFGEEKIAYKLAQAVVKQRQKQLFKTTQDLAALIKTSLPKPLQHRWTDTARRVFQALRIAVNHELENLQSFLPQALDLLNPGGRLVVVSFHSLEDRLVKQFFNQVSKGCVCPIDFPQCVCGKSPQARVLTKKPVTATAAEVKANPRSQSAKLRAVVKT